MPAVTPSPTLKICLRILFGTVSNLPRCSWWSSHTTSFWTTTFEWDLATALYRAFGDPGSNGIRLHKRSTAGESGLRFQSRGKLFGCQYPASAIGLLVNIDRGILCASHLRLASEQRLFRRIFLARRLYTRQNPNAQQYNRAHGDPVRGHVHQVCSVHQSADHDCEPNRVNSKRHGISLSSSPRGPLLRARSPACGAVESGQSPRAAITATSLL